MWKYPFKGKVSTLTLTNRGVESLDGLREGEIFRIATGREPVLSLWYGRKQKKGAEILSFTANVKLISKVIHFSRSKA